MPLPNTDGCLVFIMKSTGMLILHTETHVCPQKFLPKERSGYMLRATVRHLGETTAVHDPQKLRPIPFFIVRLLLEEEQELNSHTEESACPTVGMFHLRN
jgi:hypothetical protein